MSSPLFSIVMPTRNRADLLYYSLRSAQAQEFDDFEILVSNNYSSDETKEVVMDNIDRRTRYVSTDKVLPMPDSWDYALAHAKGKYILFLCDDDALRPDLIPFLFKVINIRNPYCISWSHARYTHPDWYEKSRRNSLRIGSYSNNITELNSSILLRDLFEVKRGEMAVRLPKMLNSCCKKEVLNKIKTMAGKTFLLTCPDYSGAAAILALIPRLLFVEYPLFLWGVSQKGIGANCYRRNASLSAFLDEFGHKSNLIIHTPLTCRAETNLIVDSFLRVKAAMPEKLNHFNLNLINYYIECRKDLEEVRRFNNDVTAEIEEFYAVLKKQDKDVKEAVLAAIESEKQQQSKSEKESKSEKIQISILQRLKNILPLKLKIRLAEIKSQILSNNPNNKKRNLCPPPGTIDGSENGFSNIAECAVKLKEMFPISEINS